MNMRLSMMPETQVGLPNWSRRLRAILSLRPPQFPGRTDKDSAGAESAAKKTEDIIELL
jgi:hypothetical protein